MANKITAPVQNEVKSESSSLADGLVATMNKANEANAIADAAQEKAKARQSVIESVTFEEAFAIASKSARWQDVLNAADAMAVIIGKGNGKYDGAKPTAIARTVAGIAPSVAMAFRFSLASYSLSGRKANATQLAELSGKLPLLATKGSLRDRAVTFGGIVLPPIAGEL